MNEIFSNLFILIPLAFLIAIRIIQSRAQRKAGPQTKQPPLPVRSIQGERGTPGSVEKGMREKRPIYPLAREVATEFKAGEFVSGEEVQQSPIPSRMVHPEELLSAEKGRPTVERTTKIVDRSTSQEEKHLSSLPEKIAKLSPWKQAVVIREILGPPKGW